MEELKAKLIENLLNFQIISEFEFEIIDFGRFLFVEPKEDIMIIEGFRLNLSLEEKESDIDYYCFQFGEDFFYTKKDEKLKFQPLKYLGKYISDFNISMPFLGIHGGFELLNGSRDYQDWIKKAKFFNIDIIGICEKNTLAGVMKFQTASKYSKIKSIIGEQVVIRNNKGLIQVKCFVKNKLGWDNLLLINKEINVTNNGKFIEKELFFKLLEGLILVIDCKYCSYLEYQTLPKVTEMYYQLDTVEFYNEEKDRDYLINLKQFIDQDIVKPILIADAYYLDKSDYKTKHILNNISGVHDYKSENQYFKSIEENYKYLKQLFEKESDCLDLFQESLNNLFNIADNCNFEIDTNKKFLAEYILTDDEKLKYTDKLDMFWDLIEKGLSEKVVEKNKDLTKYTERVAEEYSVIKQVISEFGDGIDYFLILWDIIRYCNENNILTGIGRGSGAGSLIAYLLNITKVDPFDFNLLFSRFLNAGRVESGALPDLDVDFESLRRDDIKKYLEKKYGSDHISSVGTYSTFQLKAALKDVARQNGIDFGTVNYISQILSNDHEDWQSLFELAQEKPVLKNFILNNSRLIQDLGLILKQPKSASVHACAMIIVPSNQSIANYFPIKITQKGNEDIIVSEWEGLDLESAGFLKEDILGIRQLDKYRFIIDLIKKEHNEVVDIYNIPLDNEGVYQLFQKGFNGDIFHFGSQGLTNYCHDLYPENINDLIAGIALYRPGAMDVNAHNEYVLRKNGDREFEYKWGTSQILKETYGLIIMQEQVMQIVSELGDFTLVEADDIRRAVGKKKKDIIDKYKNQFIKKVIEKGCSINEAENIWYELEVHSHYSFNKSHAAAYAITGYIGQWLKYNYPLQYWTAAFQFDDPNPKNSNISRFISEIRRTDNFIKIMPPNINESADVFASNPDKMELYWSITKVKQLGDKALEAIISEREKNGSFFSLEDFLSRVDKRVVNKAVVINLIVSGSFDEIEELKSVGYRKVLINRYYEYTGSKRDKDDVYLINHEDYWWQIRQKEVSGFGIIDYVKVLRNHTSLNYKRFEELSELPDKETETEFIVIGLIKRLSIRRTKHDDEYCRLTVDSNDEEVDVVIWNETFRELNPQLFEVGNMIAMNCLVVLYNKRKSLHSFEKTEVHFIK